MPFHEQSASQAHGKSVAQILIRWAVERGTSVIPKSATPTNIKNNIDVFDFQLTEADLKKIASLDRGYRFVHPWEGFKIPYFE